MEPLDTMRSVSVRTVIIITTSMSIAYRGWGRVILSRIVIGRVDVLRILHFTMHGHVSHWLRDTLLMNVLLVIVGHLRVLKRNMHG